SDYLGRKNNYMLYLGGGAILYLLVAFFGGGSLILFVLATLIIISFYGGGFSTVPAYLKDLFGVYQVGAIHGALLTAWSAAGVAGPLIVNSVVEAGEAAGKSGPALYTPGMFIMVGALLIGLIANALIRPVSDRHFEREDDVAAPQAGEAAGTPCTALATPGMFILVGALLIGLIANALIRPVSDKHFEREEDVAARQAAALEEN